METIQAVVEGAFEHNSPVIIQTTPGTLRHAGIENVALVKSVVKMAHAFDWYSLSDIWEDVIAVVIQPCVEFGDDSIDEYDRDAAKELIKAMEQYETLVFEGHSTDYQTPQKLRELVEDGVAILKVGPAVTFALKESLFALAKIEDELTIGNEGIRSNLIDYIDETMFENLVNW